MNLRLYSFTKPYIEYLQAYLKQEYGINAAGHQAAKYALSSTQQNPLDANSLRLINHRKLLKGVKTLFVSDITKAQSENIKRVAAQFPSLKDRSLIASGIVIATALAIQNAQKRSTTRGSHEPEPRDRH